MTFAINHIHLKSNDPATSAAWWANAFNFKIISDVTRDFGDRFVTCESENGIRVNISGPRTGETLGRRGAPGPREDVASELHRRRWGGSRRGFPPVGVSP